MTSRIFSMIRLNENRHEETIAFAIFHFLAYDPAANRNRWQIRWMRHHPEK